MDNYEKCYKIKIDKYEYGIGSKGRIVAGTKPFCCPGSQSRGDLCFRLNDAKDNISVEVYWNLCCF